MINYNEKCNFDDDNDCVYVVIANIKYHNFI